MSPHLKVLFKMINSYFYDISSVALALLSKQGHVFTWSVNSKVPQSEWSIGSSILWFSESAAEFFPSELYFEIVRRNAVVSNDVTSCVIIKKKVKRSLLLQNYRHFRSEKMSGCEGVFTFFLKNVIDHIVQNLRGIVKYLHCILFNVREILFYYYKYF